MFKNLAAQTAQYIGQFSEVIDVPVTVGSQSFVFPQVSDELKKASIIGIALINGTGAGTESVVSGGALLTAAQSKMCILHLEGNNRKAIRLPLSIFDCTDKQRVYVPIDIEGFNPQQSRIIFPTNNTVAGAIELVFFTAQ